MLARAGGACVCCTAASGFATAAPGAVRQNRRDAAGRIARDARARSASGRRFFEDGHLPSPGTVAWWDDEAPTEQTVSSIPPARPGMSIALGSIAGCGRRQPWQAPRSSMRYALSTRSSSSFGPAAQGRALDRRADSRGTTSDVHAHALIVATGRARPVVLRDVVRRGSIA